MKVLLTLFLLFPSSLYSKYPKKPAHCKSPKTFAYFLERTVSNIQKQSLKYKDYDHILNMIKRCDQNEFVKDLKSHSCLKNINNFALSMNKHQRPGHSYGFLISDDDYFSDPTRQKYLTLPPPFQDGFPKDWKKKIEELKGTEYDWDYVRFKSRLVLNTPNFSYDRLTFFRTNDQLDQWLQFTLQGYDALEKNLPGAFAYLDVIAVVKKDEQGNKLKTPKILFKEYQRNLHGKKPKLKKATMSCYACHPNGPRPIKPDLSSVTYKDRAKIEKWNQHMSSYGGIDYDGAVIPEHYGPALGSNAGQYSCTKCHNNFKSPHLQTKNHHDWKFYGRGPLNYKTQRSHIKARMVEMLEMPTYLDDMTYMKNFKSALKRGDLEEFHEKVYDLKAKGLAYQVQELRNKSIEKYLKSLHITGAIDQSHFKKAKKEVKSAKSHMRRVYKDMISSYNRELRSWLLNLNNKHCQDFFD